VFCFEGFEEDAGVLEACVGWVAAFGFVAHAGAVATARVRFGVVGTGRVPEEDVRLRCGKGV
jgi:hypothetical protein